MQKKDTDKILIHSLTVDNFISYNLVYKRTIYHGTYTMLHVIDTMSQCLSQHIEE